MFSSLSHETFISQTSSKQAETGSSLNLLEDIMGEMDTIRTKKRIKVYEISPNQEVVSKNLKTGQEIIHGSIHGKHFSLSHNFFNVLF